MSTLADALAEERLLRILAYGPSKCRKTWWAGTAAEAGFNVILICGEKPPSILAQLSPQAQERITVVNVIDALDRPVMAEFVTLFYKGRKFNWDITSKRIASVMLNEDHAHYQVDPSKLTSNDIVVIDTYGALTWSVKSAIAIEKGIDLTDARKTEWDFYQYEGNFLNWFLNQGRQLQSHLIVVAHSTIYEKYEGRGSERKLVWSREQPQSSSNPHGMQVGKAFGDILYFNRNRAGTVKINTAGTSDRDGGCENIPPGLFNWEDLQFKHVAEMTGILPPNPQDIPPQQAIVYHAPGELKPPERKTVGGLLSQPPKETTRTLKTGEKPAALAFLNANTRKGA